MAFDVAAFGIEEYNLPSNWTIGRLDSLASLNCEQVNEEYPHSQISYLDIANVSAGVHNKPVALSLADAPSRAKRVVRAMDTILSTVRPGNRAFAFMQSAPDNLVVSTGFAVLRSKPDANPRFVYYLVTSDPIITYLASIAEEKTAYPSVNPDDIAECTVPIPSLPEQRVIAHILGTLDDKIELNRRMSETLEAMARALFKSWFVDFDPVRAKADGRWRRGQSLPGLPAHLYDLFPSRLVASPLGEIPEEWEVKPFSETVEVIGGGTPKTSVPEYWDGDMPWFSVVDAPSAAEVWVIDTEKKVTQKGVEDSSTRVLPVGTTIISARGTVGRLALVGMPMAMNQSCYGLRGTQGLNGFFNYFSTRTLVSVLQQRAHGSVFDTITRDTLTGVAVIVPPDRAVIEFERVAEPLLRRIHRNLLQSRTLAVLRDTILPKLLSGEIGVLSLESLAKEVS